MPASGNACMPMHRRVVCAPFRRAKYLVPPGDKTKMPNKTLAALADDLANGRTSARKLVEECLARIADPAGEGQRAFIHVDKDAALEAADAMDHLRKAGAAPSPYAG